jgi:hypothetical protein
MKKKYLALALLGLAAPAMADTILAFGQVGTAQTMAAAAVTTDCSTMIGATCVTTIDGTDIPITVTAIDSANPVPLNAFLRLDVTASSPLVGVGSALFQEFTGTFSIRSATGGGGINYLSASFVDLVAGLSGASALSLTASNPPDPLDFTSDVMDMSKFTTPMALSFGFSDIPAPGIGSCGGVIKTLCAFTSNVSGNMSATPAAVPEPGTLHLGFAALGMMGVTGYLRKRRRFDPRPIPRIMFA